MKKSKDAYAAQCLDHLIKSTRANVVMLHRMLKKKQEHEHAMDFGEAPTSKAWDQATSNYFRQTKSRVLFKRCLVFFFSFIIFMFILFLQEDMKYET